MTVEQLMIDRYKVIADWPGNKYYNIGDIWNASRGGKVFNSEDSPKFSDFPHLFKKLQYWEERKVEDMPEYLKATNQHFVCKPEYHEGDAGLFYVSEYEGNQFLTDDFLPATESDYTTYLQSLTDKK